METTPYKKIPGCDITVVMTEKIRNVLETVFGFTAFKQNQSEIIEAILQQNDCFAAMPTGGGKSLCYQLPALILPGVTIVISPLIALMKDQVDAALESGIPAAYLNSTLDADDIREVYNDLYSGETKLLYISPERFALDSFIIKLKDFKISLFAVDEAHCLSEWGHDFRPDYLALDQIRLCFPKVPVAAFTATATRQVQTDIIKKLKLKDPFIIRASFDRPELMYKIVKKEKAKLQILGLVKDKPGQAGIIYRTSRKDVESTASFLDENGIRALPYHAGLSDKLRHRNQELFNKDETDVIVATIAFGMGIDKSNIRYVIHGDLPKNIESYYQETGRAGRDGEDSDCILLFSRGDAAKINFFIQQLENEDEQEKAKKNLQKMITFAGVFSCRRKQLLAYFDESHPGNCSSCDVCNNENDTEDISTQAQKVLSAIARTEQRFGLTHIVDIIRGSQNAKIQKFNHQNIKTYGIGKDKSKQYWYSILEELLGQECTYQDSDSFNALKITEKGKLVLFGKAELSMIRKKESSTASQVGKNAAPAGPIDPDLFEHLKDLRLKLAREQNVPPYIIFSDKTLHEMSISKPQNAEQFLQINGVGAKKLEVYGDTFISEIQRFYSAEKTSNSE